MNKEFRLNFGSKSKTLEKPDLDLNYNFYQPRIQIRHTYPDPHLWFYLFVPGYQTLKGKILDVNFLLCAVWTLRSE